MPTLLQAKLDRRFRILVFVLSSCGYCAVVVLLSSCRRTVVVLSYCCTVVGLLSGCCRIIAVLLSCCYRTGVELLSCCCRARTVVIVGVQIAK
jgi:hypothetical protein